jgi:hypothetical protein
MSYCRFSDGDVYMYPNCNGYIECCSCSLAPLVDTIFSGVKMHGSVRFNNHQEAIEHLYKHIEAGDQVPEYAIESLKNEIQEANDE